MLRRATAADGPEIALLRHGAVAIELTDGSGNEEQEPDALDEWRP